MACHDGGDPTPGAGVGDDDDDSAPSHSSTTAHTAVPEPTCPRFGPGQVVGVLPSPEPSEISGLVALDGVLWAIDDGDDALYAFDHTGAMLGAADFGDAVRGEDLEDLGLWRGQLLVADVGDNLEERDHVELFRFQVPNPDGLVDWPLEGRTRVTWPGGPTNSETILVDPVTDEVLLVQKARDGVSTVLLLPPDLPADVVGAQVAELLFGGEGLGTVTTTTGGAVAPDGSAAIIRTYLDAFVWPRVPGEPWSTTFEREPCLVDLITERQGESVAWAHDGLYTISEGEGPSVLFYPLLP